MIATATAAIKDSHRDWTTECVDAPPFDVDGFQAKINAIAGFTQVGEPVLRLIWGGTRTWMERLSDGTMKKRPRYAFQSRFSHNYGQTIPIRRWIIEENTDPAQVAAMGGTDKNFKVQEKGFYDIWAVIADHSKCPPNCKDKTMCYGDYQIPNQRVLDAITEATYKIVADKYAPDPRKMVTPEMVVPYLAKPESEEDKEAREEAENADFVRDWMKTHGVGRVSNVKPS